MLLSCLVAALASRGAVGYSNDHSPLVVMVGTPVLWLVYELFPLWRLPGFKSYSKEEIEEDLDTGGVTWSEVNSTVA